MEQPHQAFHPINSLEIEVWCGKDRLHARKPCCVQPQTAGLECMIRLELSKPRSPVDFGRPPRP